MWTYNNKGFTPDMIPEGAVGFVYIMSAAIGGHMKYYIGKKNFYSNTKVNLGKRAKAKIKDKRLKTYKRVIKVAYIDYFSSNEVLKEAHKNGVEIKREIYQICYSKMELSYMEACIQFKFGVLEKEEYLNSNILGRFFKSKIMEILNGRERKIKE